MVDSIPTLASRDFHWHPQSSTHIRLLEASGRKGYLVARLHVKWNLYRKSTHNGVDGGRACALDRVAKFRSFGSRSMPDVGFDDDLQSRIISALTLRATHHAKYAKTVLCNGYGRLFGGCSLVG